jgi:hypothetical protein
MGLLNVLTTLFQLILLSASLLISIIVYHYSNPTFYNKNLNSPQIELKSRNKIDVLDSAGRLSQLGWSRHYENFLFNPDRINPSTSIFKSLNKYRYKKWEAFVFVHDDFILETALFDLSTVGGFMYNWGKISNSESDKKDKQIFSDQQLYLFDKPFINDTCYRNCLAASYRSSKFTHIQTKDDKGNQKLKIEINAADTSIILDLNLLQNNYESMVTFTPISEDASLFYFNIKTYLIRATGKISINNRAYSSSGLFITNDSGRGVWPISSGWVWVSANGWSHENKAFGLNIGHGFNHPVSQHTEDAFFVDNVVYKLSAVRTEKLEKDNEWSDWIFDNLKDDEKGNRCVIRFTPIKGEFNVNKSIAPSVFNVKYGRYAGMCSDQNRKNYTFDILGILENKNSLW